MGGLNSRHLSLTVLKAGKKIKTQQIGCPLRIHFLVQRYHLLCVLPWWRWQRERKQLSQVSSSEGTNPIMRTVPSQPNYWPRAPHLLIPFFWELGFQNMNLRCTNMKYLAETCIEVFLAVFNFPSGSTRLGRQVNIHQLGTEVPAWISKTNYLGIPPTHIVWLGIREGGPPLLLQSRHDILFFLPSSNSSLYIISKRTGGEAVPILQPEQCVQTQLLTALFRMWGTYHHLFPEKTTTTNSRTIGNVSLFII